MNRFWRFMTTVAELSAPRSPRAGGRDEQMASITYVRTRDERAARAALYGGGRTIEVAGARSANSRPTGTVTARPRTSSERRRRVAGTTGAASQQEQSDGQHE